MRPTVIKQIGRAALIVVTIAMTSDRVQAGTIAVAFRFGKEEVRLEKQGEYTKVFLHDGLSPEETPGFPSLPDRYVFVVIPAGASPTGLTVDGVEMPLAEETVVWPAQPLYSTNDPPPAFVPPNPAAYTSNQPKPAMLAVVTGTLRLHGYTLVSLRLNPVRYVPVTKALSLATEINVTLSYKEPDRAVVASLRTVPRGATEVAELVANPQDVERFAPPGGLATPRDQSAVYLLITSNDLAAAFQPLVDRRSAQGKPGTLLTTEWIYANYDDTRPDGGQDNQTSIRNCIKDYYFNHGTVWVALGGDDNIIPIRYVLGTDMNDARPAELYYSDMDGGSWDNNANGVYGEPGDVTPLELCPEVYLGRISVRDAQQAAQYVQKVAVFEDTVPEQFPYGVLIIYPDSDPGNISGDSRPPDLRYHDPIGSGEGDFTKWYWDKIQPYCQFVPMHAFFGSHTPWDESRWGDYQLISEHLVSCITQGSYEFVVYSGHGNAPWWFLENSVWETGEAFQLANPVPFILRSGGCWTGAFDWYDPCIAEAFLRNPQGGAVVVTVYAGGPSGNHQDIMYENMFARGIVNLGQAFTLAKQLTAGSYDIYSQSIYVFLGDPAIDRRSDRPGRHLQVYIPNAFEVYDLDDDITIRWNAAGMGFVPNDKVKLEYSPDSGNSWQPVPGAGDFPYDGPAFVWEDPGLVAGSDYRVRVTSLADPNVSDASDHDFTVGKLDKLTVKSTPSSGIQIGGLHPNTTDYTYTVLTGTPVSLTAPPMDGYSFTGWLGINGNLLTRQTNLSFVLTGNKTVTARYEQSGTARDYYVNDNVAEPGFAVGDDENDGRTADTPVSHIQQILDRYDDISTIHVSTGTYMENLVITSQRAGLTLQGAGADLSIIDGGRNGACIQLNGAPQVSIRGFTIRNGSVSPDGWGGGLDILGSTGVVITDNAIYGNSAYLGGGIAVHSASDASISHNRILQNLAASTNSGWGGGIYVESSTAVITDNDIRENRASYSGAGLCINATTSVSASGNLLFSNGITAETSYGGGVSVWSSAAVLSRNVFESNAAAYGGGVFITGESSGTTVEDSQIISNTATGSGGGLYSCSPTTTISNTLIASNVTTSPGGGIAFWYCNGILRDCTITSNSGYNGGGVDAENSPNTCFSNCTVDRNTANAAGGGIYYASCSNPTLSGCSISANTAARGGGVYCSSSSLMLSGCCVADNTATSVSPITCGGGLYIASSSGTALLQSIVAGNRAVGAYSALGGGVWCGSSNVTITNSRITENVASAVTSAYGGGVYFGGSTNSMVANSTLAANAASNGGGVACSGSYCNPSLTNCILWNDAPTEVYVLSAGTPVLTYCNVRGGYVGNGNSNAAPLFWDPGGPDNDPQTWEDNDYRLAAGSPCIDAGDPNYVAQPGETDLDGRHRVWDGDSEGTPRVDMGAYEFASQACGDLNCDGELDVDDAAPFILALVDPAAYDAAYPLCDPILADMNNDGAVNGLDIQRFIEVILNPPGGRRGDVNGDGVVDLADVNVLAAVLLGVDTVPDHVRRADLNADNVADGFDIQPFVNLLIRD